MKKILLPILLTGFISCNQISPDKFTGFEYPETKKLPQVDNYFGVEVPDPYRWLEDDKSEETAQWVKAQNDVTFGYLSKIPFREKIRNRLTDIWDYPKISAPFKKGGKYFIFINDGLQNQSVLYIKDNLKSKARVILDPNKLSEDGTAALAGLGISKDGKYIAYAIAYGGSDWNEIYVKNIETGKELDEHIQWVKFSGISWFKNGFYYSRYDEPEQGTELSNINKFHKVYYHKLGTAQKEDILLYENKAHPLRNYNVSVTEDEKYLLLYKTESTSGNSLYFKDLTKEHSEFIKITDGFDYDFAVIEHIDERLLIRTNYKAPRFKLLSIDVNSPEKENWKDILPEKENVLKSCFIAGNKIVANYMKDASTRLNIYNFEGSFEREINLPAIGTVSAFHSKKNDSIAFYSFTSFTVPGVVYKYNFNTNKPEVYTSSEIDFAPSLYETRQVFYKSKDGTKIPMFIVHKKGIELNGNNPALLYGYGGFDISLTPHFSISRLIWLEQGGIFAMANIRGGGEYGEQWHRAGTKLNKQNVFDDFISAAEYLIKEKYTSPEMLAIQGGSNGGLLIGACINQRPDLFKVALAAVGVMDMLRFHKFTIGWAWVDDYGSSDDSVQFNNLYKFSPLHNISEDVEYPAVLVTTADHDDRVVPAHSFKYISTLQEKYQGSNPVMIRIDVKAGHGAGKPTSKIIETAADIWAFVFYNMGVEPEY